MTNSIVESNILADKPVVRFIMRKEINNQNKIAILVSGQKNKIINKGINPIKAEVELSGSISRDMAQLMKNVIPNDTPVKIRLGILSWFVMESAIPIIIVIVVMITIALLVLYLKSRGLPMELILSISNCQNS